MESGPKKRLNQVRDLDSLLLSDDLDQDALSAPTVELAVKDLLPRAKDFDEPSA